MAVPNHERKKRSNLGDLMRVAKKCAPYDAVSHQGRMAPLTGKSKPLAEEQVFVSTLKRVKELETRLAQ